MTCNLQSKQLAMRLANSVQRKPSRFRKAVDEVVKEEKPKHKGRGLDPRTVERLNAVRDLLKKEDAVNTPLEVRSCCYHLLSIGLLNSTKEFASMSGKITKARRRDADDPNYLDDDCFFDSGRKEHHSPGSKSIYDRLLAAVQFYERDPWQEQGTIPIILCEKAGHGQILSYTTDEEHVRLFCSKGWFGRTFLVNRIAKSVAVLLKDGKRVAIGYMGDFDASGLLIENRAEHGSKRSDGLRTILQKKHGFSEEFLSEHLTWVRLGLTKEQFLYLPESALISVKERVLNEATGKMEGDPNAPEYQKEHGDYGAEIEALGFDVMRDLVKDFIINTRHEEKWQLSLEMSLTEKVRGESLMDMAKDYLHREGDL